MTATPTHLAAALRVALLVLALLALAAALLSVPRSAGRAVRQFHPSG